MINNIYTEQNNLKLNARRVETLGRSFRPTIGDSNQYIPSTFKDKSFSQLQEYSEKESGYQNRLSPKIAVALTAANDKTQNSIVSLNKAIQSYNAIREIN
jgi:hypothetical protein